MSSWQTAVGILEKAVRAGVREFVVCGGARNAVLLEVLAKMEVAGKVRVWSHFEERSAGFFALGRSMVSGEPCGVVVTSGTAAAELLPATIEAFYQARPLVLITADRPEGFRGSGAPQSIDQEGIFSHYATTALATWEGKGPLHLNLPLEEEFTIEEEDFNELASGVFRVDFGKPRVGELAKWLRQPSMHGLVVMLGNLELEEQEEAFHFCEELAVPVVADASSGLREALQHLLVIDADEVLKRQPPSKVLRLGGVPAGRFWRDLEDLPKVEVWSVCRNGLRGLGRTAEVVQGSLERVLPALGEQEEQGDIEEILGGAEAKGQRIEEALEAFPDSEPGWIRMLSVYATLGTSVYLGNSLPIREWNRYAQWERPVRNVRVNRGANGIDGQISSWLGASAEEKDAWGIFGDLTVLYDLAGLKMLAQIENQGRVLVVMNNGGGKIFEKVPRLEGMSSGAKSWMTAETGVDFGALALAFGLTHQRISRVDDFEGPPEGGGAVLLEVVPDPKQDKAFPL